jgi:hypothetical protein
MVFSEFIVLYNHHHKLGLEHSHHPQKFPHACFQSILKPQALVITNRLSVSVDLPIPDIS